MEIALSIFLFIGRNSSSLGEDLEKPQEELNKKDDGGKLHRFITSCVVMMSFIGLAISYVLWQTEMETA